MLPFIIGAASGLSSLVGDLTEQSAAKKAKQDALNAYRKLLIPSSETETRADRAGDTLYTKTMSELNSGAFAARGALNPETLKTIAYTKMAGSRAETEFNVAEDDMKYNRSIQQQIAQIEAQPIPAINPLNALEAGVGGYLAGEQLDMALKLNESQIGLNASMANYFGKGNKTTFDNEFGLGADRVGTYDVPKVSISGKTNMQTPTNYLNINSNMDNIGLGFNYGLNPLLNIKKRVR